jgi:hypothetical protein
MKAGCYVQVTAVLTNCDANVNGILPAQILLILKAELEPAGENIILEI